MQKLRKSIVLLNYNIVSIVYNRMKSRVASSVRPIPSNVTKGIHGMAPAKEVLSKAAIAGVVGGTISAVGYGDLGSSVNLAGMNVPIPVLVGLSTAVALMLTDAASVYVIKKIS